VECGAWQPGVGGGRGGAREAPADGPFARSITLCHPTRSFDRWRRMSKANPRRISSHETETTEP